MLLHWTGGAIYKPTVTSSLSLHTWVPFDDDYNGLYTLRRGNLKVDVSHVAETIDAIDELWNAVLP